MGTKIKIEMPSVSALCKKKGIDPNGHVQLKFTSVINRRIGEYMPHLTGTLETKLKYIASPTEIVVNAPYARYQYYGVKMVDSVTGKGPAKIPNVGYRFRKGATLRPTNIPLNYTKTFNPKAGPYWDRRLMAEETDDIENEMQNYLKRGGGEPD